MGMISDWEVATKAAALVKEVMKIALEVLRITRAIL